MTTTPVLPLPPAVAGPQADVWTALLLVTGLAAVTWAVLHGHPRLAVGAWLAGTCLVPVWLGASAVFYFLPGTAIGLLVLVSLLPVEVRYVGAGDFLALAVFLLAMLPVVVGTASAAATFTLLTEVVLGFTLGRLSPAVVDAGWLYGFFAVLLAGLAVAALLELATGWNPFVALARPGSLYQTWGPLQERGGVLRAEVSFGHSIALGCTLAMAVPLALGSRFRTLAKVALVALLLAGTAATFSRVAMLCAALALALSLAFLKGDLGLRTRVTVAAGAGVVAVLLIPAVARIFEAAGSEATESAGYRGDLLSLVPRMAPLGLSEAAVRYADGTLRFGRFRSIDSELILFGLQYGWLALAAAVAGLVVAGVCVLRGRATPPTVAVVAQVPALATVALITQYKLLFWFMAGVAVATQVASSPGSPDRRADRVGTDFVDRVARP